jgi:PAS domain S-box-containing protein
MKKHETTSPQKDDPNKRIDAIIQAGSANIPNLSPKEAHELIQALLVKQTELETQNQQLITAQEDLRRSETKLQQVIEAAELGIWDHDLKANKTIRNERWAQMLGYTLAEIEDNPQAWRNLVHPDDLNQTRTDASRHNLEQTPYFKVEHRMRAKTGEWKWILNWGKTVEHDSDGRPSRALGIHLDVTERRRTEKALRDSEEMLRTVINATHEAMISVGKDGLIALFNPAAEKMFGYSKDEMLGHSLDCLMPPEYREKHSEYLHNYFSTGKPDAAIGRSMELPGMHKDGSVFPMEISLSEDKSESEHFVIAVARNITSRKRAEKELRDAEERWKAALEGSDNGVWDWNVQESSVFFTMQWKKMLGFQEHEIGIAEEEWFGRIHSEDADRVNAEIQKHFKRDTDIYSAEMRMKCKNGDYKWILSQGKVIERDSDGKPLRMIGTNIDITEHKRAQQAMLRASRMEATATLAGGIAHDFNNLMVGVLGNAELLASGFPDQSKEMLMLSGISKSAQRAGELAQQMLAFARGGKYQPKVLNINTIIDETLHLQERALLPGACFTRELAEDLWNVKADPSQMNQVVMNLCLNASEALGKEGRIIISTSNLDIGSTNDNKREGVPPGQYACLSVVDDGCGMDKTTISRVFEPFFTTKFQGRGLGLAAVYGIIKNHDGHISVNSKPGHGTTFEVLLPAYDASVQESPKLKTEVATGTETILIIDDEDTMLVITQKILEKYGYKVLTARNGEEAVEKAQTHEGELHLAILDMGMPIMDGSDTYPRLIEARPDIKVIICSGYDLDESSQAMLDAGASAFIKKPFLMNTLGHEIRRALDS